MTVWVDAWQMQCCGEPFGVGSRVSWALAERDPGWVTAVLGAGVIVDAAEDHHGGVPGGTPPTAGTVTAVSAVHCRPAPAPGQSGQAPRPAAPPAVFTPVTRADGRTRDRDGLNFAGYLVHLSTSRHPVPSAWVPITAAVAEGRRGSPVPRHAPTTSRQAPCRLVRVAGSTARSRPPEPAPWLAGVAAALPLPAGSVVPHGYRGQMPGGCGRFSGQAVPARGGPGGRQGRRTGAEPLAC
jgi:hypothetical protein